MNIMRNISKRISAILIGVVFVLVAVTFNQHVTSALTTAQLTLVKTVVNDNGGTATVSSFQLLIYDPVMNSFSPVPSGAAQTLNPGSYTVSENGDPAHYTASVWGGDCNADGTITLIADQVATCTITNDDIAPAAPAPATLHIIKLVVNANSGASIASDFNVNVKFSGINVTGSPQSGTTTPGTLYTLSAGTYVVSEIANAYYVQSFTGACDASGSVTLAPGDDKTCTIVDTDIPLPPAITDVGAVFISSTQATISWTTNVPAVSLMEFWTNFTDGASVRLPASALIAHDATLVGLFPNTVYLYCIHATGLVGSTANSCGHSFTTTGPPVAADTTPPSTSLVAVSSISADSASIQWSSSEIANSQIQYGTTMSYGSETPIKTESALSGNALLSNLTPSTTYHFRVRSYDLVGNVGFSGDYTFMSLSTSVVSAPAPAPVSGVGGGGNGPVIGLLSGGGGSPVVGFPSTGSIAVVPLIGIIKIPSPLALPRGTGVITYNYTVWNVGGLRALVGITVTDDKCAPVTMITGDSNNNGKLDPGENWKYTCTTTLSTTTTNTSTAIGHSDDGFNQVAINTAIATVVVGAPIPSPLITIITVPSRLTVFPVEGGDITYTYTVTNPGVAAIHNVVVADNKCAPVSGPSGDINGNNLLDSNETWTYTCHTHTPVSTMNIATAEGRVNGMIAIGYAFSNVLVSLPGFPNTGPVSSNTNIKTIIVNLQKGSHGSNITILQEFLIAQNIGPAAQALAANGATMYFGNLTRAALAEFQASVGISPALGNFGPITRAFVSAHF